MAKGSQLSQLKSALSQAGLSRQPPSSKKRKRALSATGKDREKKEHKLQEIQRKLNPFDVKVTRLKHDVGGRKLKGVSGKPQESSQAGLEKVRIVSNVSEKHSIELLLIEKKNVTERASIQKSCWWGH